MKSANVKRSIVVGGHKTSITLEDVLGRTKGNRAGQGFDGDADGYSNRRDATTGKPVFRDPLVCTRPGPFTKSGATAGTTVAPISAASFGGRGD